MNKLCKVLIIIFIIIFLFFFIVQLITIFLKTLTNSEIKNYTKNFKITNNLTIPNNIIITHKNISLVPKKVLTRLKKFSKGYNIKFFDDDDCISFISKHFGQKYVDKFNSYKIGAHKADLFRYCYLYINGGIYLDIKTFLIKQISEIFDKKDHCYFIISNDNLNNKLIYQGIIATPPKNIIFKIAIDKMIKLDTSILQLSFFTYKPFYLLHTFQLYQIIKNLYKNVNKNKLYPLIMLQEKCKNSLFDPSCKNPDRYNLCCFIYNNNEKLFNVRYPDFPWKKPKLN